jgi:hypothetical protein
MQQNIKRNERKRPRSYGEGFILIIQPQHHKELLQHHGTMFGQVILAIFIGLLEISQVRLLGIIAEEIIAHRGALIFLARHLKKMNGQVWMLELVHKI